MSRCAVAWRHCAGVRRFEEHGWLRKAAALGWPHDELFALRDPFANGFPSRQMQFVGNKTVTASLPTPFPAPLRERLNDPDLPQRGSSQMSNDISHLLIEALEKGEVGLSIKKGSVVADHVLRAGVSSVRMPHALRDIRASHRFDISGVVPTLSSELSLTAIDQNADGQLHLPFEGCLFDFGLDDHGERTLILAGEGDHDLAFSLFFLEGGEWGTYPYVLMVRKGEPADTCIYFRPLFEGFPLAAEPSDENPALEWFSAKSLAALAMMDSESVKLEAVTAPKFINAKRAAKGKPPLSDYTLVTIDMDRVSAGYRAPGRRRALGCFGTDGSTMPLLLS